MALSILRLIGEDARKERTMRVIVQVPVDVATYLINEKRDALRSLEHKGHAQLVLVPNPHIQTPEYSIRRVRDDEMQLPENAQVSYQIPAAPPTTDPLTEREKRPPTEQPAVAALLPKTAAPISADANGTSAASGAETGGLWQRLKRWLGAGNGAATAPTVPASASPPVEPRRDSHRSSGMRRDRDGRGRRPERRPEAPRRDEPRRDAPSARGPDRGREEPRREPRRDEPRPSEPRREPEAAAASTENAAEAAPTARHTGRLDQPAVDRPRSSRSRRGGRRRRRGGGGNREAGGPNAGPEGQGESRNNWEASSSEPASAGNVNTSAEASSEPREAGEPSAPSAHAHEIAAPVAPEPKPFVVWSSAPAAEPGPSGPRQDE
jgi:ribonuclease E